MENKEPRVSQDGLPREIKFRAFVHGEMIYRDDPADIFGNYSSNIMQYTGLKDKNGIEIYEGDIVQTEGYKPHIVERKDRLHGGDLYGYAIADDCKVIGNIFENPNYSKPQPTA